ncbi:MAG: fasciclin domain-containing protein [Saonia sp.]
MVAIVFVIMFLGCNYTAFEDKNSQISDVLAESENVVDIIPTGMSLPNLHTIEDIIEGNPEFNAVEDILKTYGAFGYLRELKAVTLLLPVGNEFDLKTCKYLEAVYTTNGTKGIVDVFLSHAIDGRYDKATIISKTGAEGLKVTTLNKHSIIFLSDDNGLHLVSDSTVHSRIKIFNQFATNGIIHGIEHWLIPCYK